MPRFVGRVLSAGLALFIVAAPAHPAPAGQVTKDAKGRVVSRKTTNPDQSSHMTSFQYRADSQRPLVVADVDLDQFGNVTKRVEQRFDGQGRVTEKLDLRIDVAGRQTGTRTRYHYDESGRRSEQAIPVY